MTEANMNSGCRDRKDVLMAVLGASTLYSRLQQKVPITRSLVREAFTEQETRHAHTSRFTHLHRHLQLIHFFRGEDTEDKTDRVGRNEREREEEETNREAHTKVHKYRHTHTNALTHLRTQARTYTHVNRETEREQSTYNVM